MPKKAAAALRAAARLNARGIRGKAAGDYDGAERNYRRALAFLERAVPGDRDAAAAIHHNLGGLDHARGDYPQGEAAARRGLALRLSGPADAARVGADLIALAALVQGQRRFDESERLYLAGLTLLRQVPSPDKFDIAVGLGGLGVQYAECGHYKAAVRLLERSAALKAAVLAPDHPSVLLAKANLSAARIREPRSRSSPLRCAGDRRPA